MIKKIVQISGVGRFNFEKEDYQSDIPEFDHSTVIYADNTMGKSTLSDIFRSLTEEKNLIIKDRKTIDSDKGQLIKIEIDQQDFIFANGRWIERDNPSIQIFDETFVNEHIISGYKIDSAQKKELVNFFISEKTRKLIEESEEIKISISKSKKQISELENKSYIVNDEEISLGSFSSVKEFFVDLPDDLTAEITHLRAKISELKNADTIRNLKKLTKLPLMSSLIFKRFPEKELDELQAWVISKLNKQIAISRETLEKITEYLNDLPQSLGEDWLQSGAEVEVLDECPFCGQGLENDGGRINHLRNYFKDESYREKKSKIGKIIELCSRERLLENARDLEADNRENQEVLAKWNQIYDDQKISLKLELDTSRIEDPLTTLLDFLESKRKEPVGRINEDETQLIQEYFEAINGIDEKIGEYNRNIERQNQRIKSAKKRNRNQGDSNLSKLREKMRFTVLALHCKNNDDSAIDDLIQKREDLNKLQRQYDELKDERKEQFQQDADIYGDNVDEYIKRFNRDFGVYNFTIRYHGQSKIPSSEMRFSLNGVEISNDVSARSLNMRTALSTSDRRVLALSLFLSKLESMNNLSEQIVVLDDPFSSFDSPNRHSIMRELAELSKRVKQLIILTHDLRFGFKLSQALKKKDKEGVTILKIERQDKSSSIIKDFSDISAVDISDHLQRLETIEGYIEGQHQDAKKAVKEARPVLERYLRTKYSNVHDCKNLGCIIGRMKAMNFIGEERIAILEYLNDYLPEFSHDDLSDPKYSDLEIENYLEQTIEYIKE